MGHGRAKCNRTYIPAEVLDLGYASPSADLFLLMLRSHERYGDTLPIVVRRPGTPAQKVGLRQRTALPLLRSA